MEEREICNLTPAESVEPVIPINQFSNFTHLKRVTAWILRLVNNSRSTVSKRCTSPHLTVPELNSAEDWLMVIQRESFPKELDALEKGRPLPKNSRLLPFRPIWDSNTCWCKDSLLLAVILDGLILSEHQRLMHAGPTLLLSKISHCWSSENGQIHH